MKIAVDLTTMDPGYRGGGNSYIHGLLGGFQTLSEQYKMYLICFKEAEDFSKFCSAGGMDQLQGPQAATIEDKSTNKDWED